jgi:hypothetical protein
MMIRKNDMILIGAIIIIAVAALFIVQLTKSDGARVVITVDGENYKTLDLNKDTTVNITKHDENKNIIEIKDGKVKMIEANCPDKLCVKHNSIHYNYETIVCLPHKVVVEIVDGEESDIDMIAK